MNCPYCNAQLPEDAVFCGHCGNKLNEEAPTMQVPAYAEVPTYAQVPAYTVAPAYAEVPSYAQSPAYAEVTAQQPQKKSALFLVLTIVLAVIVLGLGALNVWQYFNNTKLQDNVAVLETDVESLTASVGSYSAQLAEKNEEISTLESDLSESQQEVSELNADLFEVESQLQQAENDLWFYDNHVVFIDDDGTNTYHTYGCWLFEGESFWAYNTKAAESKGYNPCPYCQ